MKKIINECLMNTQPPNNRQDALKYFKSTLEKKPLMKQHYFDLMQKLFDNGHAEPAPQSSLGSAVIGLSYCSVPANPQ